MATRSSVHTAIDLLTASVLSGYTVVYDNADYEDASRKGVPFVAQTVSFRENNQFELGRPDMRRQHGVVAFLVHARKGTGASVRNTLVEALQNAFSSRVIGGATFVNATELPLGVTGSWAITRVEIPFHYEVFR